MITLLAPFVAVASDLQPLVDAEWRREAPEALVAAAPADGKAALARALGRLRSTDALPHLVALKDDPDPAVRVAVAEALGWTPGGDVAIREWLDALPVEARPPGRPRLPSPPGVRPALLASLGFHASPTDVERLRAEVHGQPAAAAAAAISLGRLGRAGVPEAAASIPDLVGAAGAFDRVTSEAAAFALFRITLATASSSDVAMLYDRWAEMPTGSGRAWVLRALWPVLDLDPEAEAALLARALKDKETVVRVAALDVAGPGDLDPEAVAGFLGDSRANVRTAALSALGRIGGDDAIAILRTHAGSADPWQAGAAIGLLAGLGVAPDDGLLGAEHPEAVRAAVAGTLTDPDRLEALALGDPHTSVRTAAIGAMIDLEAAPDVERVKRLLAATDEAVREGAVALLDRLDPEVAAPLRPAAAPAWALPDGVTGDLDAIGAIRGAVVRTSKGTFRLSLDSDAAPIAVASFAALAERDFFDGLLFHRVVPGFVAQGGDPRGDGWGGPGYTLPDEVSALPYDPGALGMARSDRDTGGSQWFVTLTNQPHLVGDYTRFGHVEAGLQVVTALERGDRILDVAIERVP